MSCRSAPMRICKPCLTAAHWLISITRMPLRPTKHSFMLPVFTPRYPIKARPILLRPIMLNCVTTWLGSPAVHAAFLGPFTLSGARLNFLSLPGIGVNSSNMNSQRHSLMSAISFTLDLCHSHQHNLEFCFQHVIDRFPIHTR